MMIFIIAAVVIILFVLGVTLIYKGYTSTPDPLKVVAKEDFTKLQEESEQAHQEQQQLKLQLDAMAVRLEEAKIQWQEAQRIKESLSVLEGQDNAQKAALNRLEADVSFLAGKADTQAQDAVEVINTLLAENEFLRDEVSRAENKVAPEDIARLNEVNLSLKEQIEEHLAKIKELEDVLAKGGDAAPPQDGQGEAVIRDLSQENERLKQGLKTLTAKIDEFEDAFQQAREEEPAADASQAGETLVRLKEASDQITRLEEEIQRLQEDKASNDKRIKELESVPPAPENNPQVASAPDSSGGGTLAPAPEAWEKEKTVLEATLQQIQTANETLREREKILQLQLTKNRAKAMGLEKICASFKKELEQRSAVKKG